MLQKAIEKLEAGKKAKLDKYGEVMKQPVADALIEFCRQDEEFAQAVVQGGKFEDMMLAVRGAVHGGAISDMEAYGTAVKFFFPGAEIKVTMTIDLVGAAAEESGEPNEAPDGDAVIIDLSEFF